MRYLAILATLLFALPTGLAQELEPIRRDLVDFTPIQVDGSVAPAPVSSITFTKTNSGTTFQVAPAAYWDCNVAIGGTAGSAICYPALREEALCLNTWVDIHASGVKSPPKIAGISRCGDVTAACGHSLIDRIDGTLLPQALLTTHALVFQRLESADTRLAVVPDVDDSFPLPPPPPPPTNTSSCFDADSQVDLDDRTPWRCNVSWGNAATALATCGLGDP